MADNVTFQTSTIASPPNATVVAADDVGGALYQRVKLSVGADGTVADFSGAVKMSYGTEAQAITCTLTSLASSATAGRESTAISNTTNLFTDVLVMGKIKLASGTIGNDKRVYVWSYGTVDGTTPLYPDTVTGSDAAITMNSPVNLKLLGVIEAPAQSTTYIGGPWSLAQLYGSVPQKWGIVVQNYTNIGFSTVAADCSFIYQGVASKLV